MSQGKVFVVMTASGKVKEHVAASGVQEILEDVYREYQSAGSCWDRPTRLFVDGECVVASGLADIAWEYGKFRRRQEDMVDGLLEGWVNQRFGGKAEGEAA